MHGLSIGIQLAGLRQPFRRAVQTAARLGARAVEIDGRRELLPADLVGTALREVRNLLAELDIRVSAISFPTRSGYAEQERLEERTAATKKAMKMAADLGARAVINDIGPIPENAEHPDWPILIGVLTELGRYGERVGAVLAAQTSHCSAADLARLIAALPTGSIGVNFDTSGAVMRNESATESLALLAAQVVHMHARDATRDLSRRMGVEMPLGRGSVDFLALFGILEEHRYRGAVTIARETGANPEAEFAQGISYLQNLLTN